MHRGLLVALFVPLLAGAGCAKGAATSGQPKDMAVVGPADLSVGDGPRGAPDLGADPLASQFMEVRGVMHVHSVYSHDACDGDGLPGGQRNQPCWNDLRNAACSVGLDFVGLTDHPAFMRDYPLADEVLFDGTKGDELIMEAGQVIGNRIKCDDGRRVVVTEGYEANHTLPVGFTTKPTTDSAYGDIETARPIAEVQAMVAELKGAGALVASVHSERSDLTAATLLASGVEAMEWYNPHGNFKTVLGAEDGVGLGALDALDFFGAMAPFMTGSSANAHPDLVYLLLLPKWPQAGFDKWREVQRTRTVTGILGSDVHQNVSVAPLCTGALAVACQLAAAGSSGKTQALALLAAGGQIVMGDGKRLDAYERILRWLENRILVTELSPTGVKDALRAGRTYGLFSVFGAPEGFRFVGQANGMLFEMGAVQKAPVALTVRTPRRAVALKGAQFSAVEGEKVELRATLYRTTATETIKVKESVLRGDTMSWNATESGAYHVEVWAKPKHLVAALGTESALADLEYLWFISNPIRVTP